MPFTTVFTTYRPNSSLLIEKSAFPDLSALFLEISFSPPSASFLYSTNSYPSVPPLAVIFALPSSFPFIVPVNLGVLGLVTKLILPLSLEPSSK